MGSAVCKKCSKCQVEKPLDNFRKDKRRKSGLKNVCKACADARYKEYKAQNPEVVRQMRYKSYLKNKYNLSVEAYNSMLESQDNKCAVCKSESTNNSLYKTMVVDHDHSTGYIRGLLCHPCNSTLGASLENIERLIKCANYLQVKS